LGRSFTVKLWPTLIFLKDGQEVARVVRPTEPTEILAGLQAATA
jgi:thioredoxin 1